MSGIVNKVVKVGTLGLVDDVTGADAAAGAARQASATAAGAQMEALEYLKQREALPQQFREAALAQQAGMYGLEGGTGSQQQLIDQAQQSPLYAAIMGTQAAGQEAAERRASMMGLSRSGNIQDETYSYNANLQNQALLQSYNQQLSGLQGLASLPSNANAIAQGTAGVGMTQAQGITGAAQAHQDATGMIMSGLGQAGAAMFSDSRLKSNVSKTGVLNGHNIYSWDWNDSAASLGLYGSDSGVIAQEIVKTNPDAVGESDGYLTVDYSKLGL